jgi:ElaB/YqjD/DUF883 family membrane-anchored ribosome-binding protein
MAETLHRSSDVPNFDTYPATPPEGTHLLPVEQNKTALEHRAEQVGTAMGKVVVMLRRSQGRLRDATADTRGSTAARLNDLADTAKATAQDAAARISDLADTARARAQEWTETAASRAEELRQVAAEKASDLRAQARTGYYRARLRANQVARDYPIHVILAAGACGFLLGVGLRIWRASREY